MQLSKPDKTIHAGGSARRKCAQFHRTQILAAEPVEHLDEDQPIGQRGGKPDDHFFMSGESSECSFTRFQVLPSLLQRSVPDPGDEAGAGFAPGRISRATRVKSFSASRPAGAGPSKIESP
jgi:hypothetical protein